MSAGSRFGKNSDLAAFRRGLDRIGDEIGQYLHYPAVVREDRGRFAR